MQVVGDIVDFLVGPPSPGSSTQFNITEDVIGAIPLIRVLMGFFRRPNIKNPTLNDIQARHKAEEAQRRAEEVAKKAQEHAERTQREAESEREQARERQAEANIAAARAAEEAERMRAQVEESSNAVRRAQELAEEASRATREDAERFAQEAQEDARKAKEDAERAVATAKEEAERAQRAADEQRREAEAAKALADDVARAAAEETRKAMETKKEAERRLKEGIQPIVTPSPEEVAAAKQRIEYKEDCFHFAIAGTSGSGKSSLVNAFRGLHTKDAGAAAVGSTETTLHLTRYPNADPENPFVWYDIPGAGTLKFRDWQYFNEQGLYVFDCIIVLFDNRFTITDVAILLNARRFNIPTYIVRSKADQHILNNMKDMGYDSDEEDGERKEKLKKAARKKFIDETRRSVRTNLEDANLPDQRVYIITSSKMLQIVRDKGQVPKKAIDEVELVTDLFNQAYSRRVTQSNAEIGASSGTG